MKRKQKKIGISYAITVNDELTEFKRLINTILPYVDNFKDEIVILQDEGIDGIMRNKKMEIAKFIKEIQEKFNQSKKIYYYTKALINNFAEHKNFLINKCNKEYIFQLDADEYPSKTLLKELNNILNLNRKAKIDVIYIPRVNKVKGLTDQHIHKWHWQYDEKTNRINWPDYQMRIFKNDIDNIYWIGKVHERLTGFHKFAKLPILTEDYALVHIKDINKQERQNQMYEDIYKMNY